ncbi:hypothetical protein LIER_12380 [Lithospermum erythrorhizon]|uniref:MULE transposase domain-containing protein n=1 Tax=Lithospermum erythrorhizon TaxID=34254 RepID=A0AAV3PRH5_LITER
MTGFICERHHEGHTNDTYMALYREEKNLFSVRVHYHGRFVANPSLSYEGGNVELFDCCNADTFELDPEVEGHNGISCLKYSKNIVRFGSLICEHKFINFYFIGSSNTQLLDDIDDGGEYSISVNRATTELIKVSVSKRDMLPVIPFNLVDNNDNVKVNENDIEKWVDVDDEDNEKDKDNVENEEDENDFEYSETEESEKKLNPKDVLYRKEQDGVDDGDLPREQPILSSTFLENIEEAFMVPEHDGHSEEDVGDRHDMSDFDSGDSTSDSDGTIDVTKLTVTARKKKRYVHFNDKNIKNPKLCSGIKKLNDTDLVIKTISRKHKNCLSAKKRRIVKSTWLAKILQDWFRHLPDISISVIRLAVDKKYGLLITDNQARRVGEKALKEIEGDHNDLVWGYIEELKRAHPGSTVFAKSEESDEDVNAKIFKRVYVCLRPLIEVFKIGCRKLIELNGCHIKGVHKQQILTTVALDPNNGWWPLCWVVVEKENKETYKWFIQALTKDMGIVDQDC